MYPGTLYYPINLDFVYGVCVGGLCRICSTHSKSEKVLFGLHDEILESMLTRDNGSKNVGTKKIYRQLLIAFILSKL